MLEIDNLHVKYGDARVLNGLDLKCEPGKVMALVGPNGAGKSTVVKAISGLVSPTQGSVKLDGRNVPAGDPAATVRMGIKLVPQGRALFETMTVRENLRMGCFLPTVRDRWQERLEMLGPEFPEVMDRLDEAAGTLSGGQQQLVAIMRGMMTPGPVLMLDEPSLGVAPILVRRLGEVLQRLAVKNQVAVLLVEQNMNLVRHIADGVSILGRGRTQMVVHPDKLAGEDGERLLKQAFFGSAKK